MEEVGNDFSQLVEFARQGGKGKELFQNLTADNAYQTIIVGDNLYFASSTEESVVCLNAKTGKKVKTYLTTDETKYWGFLAIEKNLLIGSNQNKKATLNFEPSQKFKAPKGKNKELKRGHCGTKHNTLVVSETLFALDKATGEKKWEYKKNSYILNPSITIGNGEIFFAECRNQSVPNAKEVGFLFIDDFWDVSNYT